MALIDIKVPDIGDFDEVAVIELLVKAGDVVKAEQSLITVESDKASMEIPCSQAGVVKEIKVKLGDKVKQGSVVLVLEGEATASAAAPAASAPQATAPVAAASTAPAALALQSTFQTQLLTVARSTSNVTCWSWALGPAVTQPLSAQQIWVSRS
jgi:dihydrolipoamide dehydrogenase